jgi:3-phosphoshikimate 1-carboxyvinyltransferase
MSVEISVPGSKSIANRALILNHLCGNHTELLNLPDCDDVQLMIQALESIKNHDSKEKLELNTGYAGTTTRFISAIASLLPYPCTIDGNERMRQRPIKELTEALNQLGAKVKDNEGFPPISTSNTIPHGGEITIKGHISSQYLSAILMITPFLKGESIINIEGDLCSKPYIDITLKLLEEFGLIAENNEYQQFKIAGEQLAKPPKTYRIEADASSASYIAAYAALNKDTPITIKNLSQSSIQGDIEFMRYLEIMGCDISSDHQGTRFTGPKKLKRLGEINMNHTPDLVMTFAILSIFAEGITKISNIPNLRIKETDRIEALENELGKLGIEISTGKDYIEIESKGHLNHDVSAEIETYDDHRIAMCFGILTNNYPGIKILNPGCVSKSYTTFWDDINKLKQ